MQLIFSPDHTPYIWIFFMFLLTVSLQLNVTSAFLLGYGKRLYILLHAVTLTVLIYIMIYKFVPLLFLIFGPRSVTTLLSFLVLCICIYYTKSYVIVDQAKLFSAIGNRTLFTRNNTSSAIMLLMQLMWRNLPFILLWLVIGVFLETWWCLLCFVPPILFYPAFYKTLHNLSTPDRDGRIAIDIYKFYTRVTIYCGCMELIYLYAMIFFT